MVSLRELIDAAPAPERSDMESICEYYSDAFKDLYGYRPKELEYASWGDFLAEYHDVLERLEFELEEQAENQHAAILEFENEVKNVMNFVQSTDREDAIRIIAQGHDIVDAVGNFDVYHLEFLSGLPYGYIADSMGKESDDE